MEEWKEFHGYKVSNYGRIVNRKGVEVKGYVSNERGYQFHCLLLRYDGKRHLHRKSILVYSLFKDYPNGARVYHIDGDITNCHIDNLRIARAYTEKLTAKHIEIYKNNIEGCVKDLFTRKKWWCLERTGFDVDNLLAECYYRIYRWLPSYTVGNSFYLFCAKVSQWVFLELYKKFKQESKHLVRHSELKLGRTK